jgi:uncharacterized protein YbjT (DUF2867 family)
LNNFFPDNARRSAESCRCWGGGRRPAKANRLPAQAQIVVDDVTRPETLSGAVERINAIVFTLGSAYFGKNEQSDRTNLNKVYGSI